MSSRAILLLFSVFVAELCSAQNSMRSPSTRLGNTAKPAGDGRYDWTVFIITDTATLSKIKAVEYTLPPTLSKPVRIVTTGREKGFPLSSNTFGGEFTIFAKVFYYDGTTSSLKYRLDFVARSRQANNLPPPTPVPIVDVQKVPLTTGNTSRNLGVGRWEWSVFVIASDDVLRQIQYVEYTLHPTFPEPIQKVTQRGVVSGKGFFLNATGWGTFEIAVKVVFTDGKARFVKHQLKFG